MALFRHLPKWTTISNRCYLVIGPVRNTLLLLVSPTAYVNPWNAQIISRSFPVLSASSYDLRIYDPRASETNVLIVRWVSLRLFSCEESRNKGLSAGIPDWQRRSIVNMRDPAPSTQPRGFLTKQHETRHQLSSSSCLERHREVLVPHPFQSNLTGSSSFSVIIFGSEDRISHSEYNEIVGLCDIGCYCHVRCSCQKTQEIRRRFRICRWHGESCCIMLLLNVHLYQNTP